jgi:hypothetical protein
MAGAGGFFQRTGLDPKMDPTRVSYFAEAEKAGS